MGKILEEKSKTQQKDVQSFLVLLIVHNKYGKSENFVFVKFFIYVKIFDNYANFLKKKQNFCSGRNLRILHFENFGYLGILEMTGNSK